MRFWFIMEQKMVNRGFPWPTLTVNVEDQKKVRAVDASRTRFVPETILVKPETAQANWCPELGAGWTLNQLGRTIWRLSLVGFDLSWKLY